jgi:hypothetical protein
MSMQAPVAADPDPTEVFRALDADAERRRVDERSGANRTIERNQSAMRDVLGA